ncbi:M48 family metalloprotease [Halorubellus sp. JP-L1]|uniref:M48 family metallopeptidase n=1 Tax=Halorubellus sp. JP-L1 TaxID=2715753 RepID=UPI00140A5B87|nr:M48 family metalloprotease [Halorubellus sp. JP-L1]NHN43248.1 M48 family metalloprotease [Halorubellus sp. JP-L1]
MRHTGLKLRMAVVGTILFAFYAAAGLVVYAMYGPGVIPLVVVGSVVLIGFQYKVGKWAALRSVGAEDMPEHGEYSRIHQEVGSMSRDMGIDKPRLMVADMGVPNAFAVGRKGAGTVVVSTELLRILDRDEVDGVLAHELAHIANRDVVMMVLGQGIASVVGIVAQFVVLLAGDNDLADFFLAIIVGNVVQFIVMLFVLAISRYREYVADADARRAIGSGDPLARALEKISRGAEGRESKVDDQVSALCIFGDGGSMLSKLVSTHPPMEKRIERLRT